jgi:hypothetical protein
MIALMKFVTVTPAATAAAMIDFNYFTPFTGGKQFQGHICSPVIMRYWNHQDAG